MNTDNTETIEEILEDLALVLAIQEGEKGEKISREAVFQILEDGDTFSGWPSAKPLRVSGLGRAHPLVRFLSAGSWAASVVPTNPIHADH